MRERSEEYLARKRIRDNKRKREKRSAAKVADAKAMASVKAPIKPNRQYCEPCI